MGYSEGESIEINKKNVILTLIMSLSDILGFCVCSAHNLEIDSKIVESVRSFLSMIGCHGEGGRKHDVLQDMADYVILAATPPTNSDITANQFAAYMEIDRKRRVVDPRSLEC